jgi:Flp pilus assembly pilin Flp
MKQFIVRFVRDEQGQDLIEYTLLLAFVCLASAALFIGAGNSLRAIWTTANATISNANTAANPS